MPPTVTERGAAWRAAYINDATVTVLSRMRKTSAEEVRLELRAPVEPLKQAAIPADAVAALMLLAPQSAAAKLFELAVKVDLAGVSSFSFPLPSNFTEAKFVVEGEPIPVGQGTFEGMPLGPVRKVALLGALSGALENFSAPVASVIIGHVLKVAVDKGLAKVLFSADAATEAAPAGLLFGVTPLTAGASMSEDLSALVAAIADAGIDAESVVFVASTAQAMAMRLAAGPLFSYRVIGAPIAPGTVIAVATSGLAVAGEGLPVVDVSKGAVLHMSDTPTDIGLPAVAPDPSIVAAPTISLFQVDALALRCIARVTWSAAPGAVQVVNGAVW
ncbi:hypothetical protein I6F30_29770 [Bradyrhizobium sp. NBAIM20]|uniref:hypothetical protein n=1 Tax=unclassified Bradyrhizobium TaxID=2631580 RepID=UPI001CD1A3F9|nr:MULTISPECIES: hypothetical protein [unclassified Bradyrhizobium]MCA1415287.1 hypothetical protein [Bradyrhizobium sp. NBAIM20]